MFGIETIATEKESDWAITTLLDLYPGEVTSRDRAMMDDALVMVYESKLEYLLFHQAISGIKDPKDITLRELITCLHFFPNQSIIVANEKVYCIYTEDLDKFSGFVIKTLADGSNPEIWTHLERH